MFPNGYFSTGFFPGTYFPPAGEGIFYRPEFTTARFFEIRKMTSDFNRDLVWNKFEMKGCNHG